MQQFRVDNRLKEPIVFFCKDCQKIVDVKPVGRKFCYRCAICDTKNVAFGTEQSVRNFYHVDEIEQTDKIREARERENAGEKASGQPGQSGQIVHSVQPAKAPMQIAKASVQPVQPVKNESVKMEAGKIPEKK
jgi:hypothetical protein